MTALNMPNAYGTWHVTTEGDCEGRSTRDLGTHTGYLDEIALQLADKVYYGLHFSAVSLQALDKKPKTGVSVQVALDIGTGSWDLHGQDRVNAFKEMLKGRPVHVSEGQYYACVQISSGRSPEELAAEKQKLLRAQALAALSKEQIEALRALGV